MTKEFQTVYNRKKFPGLTCTEDLAKQAHKSECDINTIVKKHLKHGIPFPTAENKFYADLSEIGDFQKSMETVLRGQELFSALPAPIRERFSNDPYQYLNFASNPANKAEMAKLGLIHIKAPASQPPKEGVLDKTPENGAQPEKAK